VGEGGEGEGGRGEASKKGGGEPKLKVLIDSGKVGLVQNRQDEVGQGEKC